MTKTLPEKWTPNRDEVLKALGAVSETEYKKLQEQLQIAKASDESAHIRLYNERGETRKLQKQLKEANEVIESLRTYDFTVDDENAEYYQVKWNVEAKRFYKNRKWGVK